MSKKKQQTALDPQLEAEAAKALGRHVSEEKGWLLLACTVLACLVPVVLGLRLWDSIPEIIETGLVGADGEDDSLPRWAAVFLVPGLFCLLNLINHLQLRRFQQRQKMPPRHTLLLGRWGFPLVGLLFCAWMLPTAAGRAELIGPLMLFWSLGWAVMMLSGALWDCPPDSRMGILLPAGLAGGAAQHAASAAGLAAGLAILFGAAIVRAV